MRLRRIGSASRATDFRVTLGLWDRLMRRLRSFFHLIRSTGWAFGLASTSLIGSPPLPLALAFASAEV